MNKTKLKNLKWEIPGYDSDRPLKECIEAIMAGLVAALFLIVILIIFI